MDELMVLKDIRITLTFISIEIAAGVCFMAYFLSKISTK